MLPTLAHELTFQGDLLSRASLDLLRGKLLPALFDARRATDELLLRLHTRLESEPGGVLRLGDDFASDPVWSQGLTIDLEASLGAFRGIRDAIETIVDRLTGASPSERRDQLLQELRGVMRRMEAASDGLNRTLRPAAGGPPMVRWMERTGAKGQQVALAAVPLDLAPILRELLFERVDTVALTSATLAAGGDFNFLESRLGLSGEPSLVSTAGNPAVAVRLRGSVPVRHPRRCAGSAGRRAGPLRGGGPGRS